MAGMYIHIPFCRKICSYCDFYKTTLISLVPGYLQALGRELRERKSYLQGDLLETIYLGGGTPSLIEIEQLERLFGTIMDNFKISADCEITMEANPDDLSPDYLRALRGFTPINRLSIGIQSFRDDDLVLLNRRHTARQATDSINQAAMAGFANITVDLIYGLPRMNTSEWEKNLNAAFSHPIQHLSAYHLTVEPNTSFSRMAARGLIRLPADDESSSQFILLNKMAGAKGFYHYEISNLAKDGYMSKHNSSYWLQKKYIGLGPSAHSYDLVSRQWNTRNVKKYIEALSKGIPYAGSEMLDLKTRYHEYLMLSLRTAWGLKTTVILSEFGEQYLESFEKNIQPFLNSKWILRGDDTIKLTPEGWMVSDYIIERLMME